MNVHITTGNRTLIKAKAMSLINTFKQYFLKFIIHVGLRLDIDKQMVKIGTLSFLFYV